MVAGVRLPRAPNAPPHQSALTGNRGKNNRGKITGKKTALGLVVGGERGVFDGTGLRFYRRPRPPPRLLAPSFFYLLARHGNLESKRLAELGDKDGRWFGQTGLDNR